MTESQSYTPMGRGVVGRRQLLAMQTFDIARLTTHAVPIVPNTFIAVSGVGPRNDSNGSGKTSFLSAVSILLADPQWRLDVNGGRFASGVLFKPDAAGVSRAQQIPAAAYGYIVGVFAEPEDAMGTCLTVWVRVATAAPYVQVRWTGGLHIADAETDPERDLQADSLWNALSPASAISARRMGEELYGAAPRCLTYLDTPLRPSIPSLLSQQMTEMEPRDIGDSLIALSGLKNPLDDEEKLRAELLTHQRNLDEAEKNDERATIEEEADLAGVFAREQARQDLDQAQKYWRLYVGRRCEEIREEDRALESEIVGRADLVGEAEQVTADELQTFERLRKDTSTADEARLKKVEWQQAREVVEELRLERGTYASRQGALAEERRSLSPKLASWSGASVEDAASAVTDAQLERAAAEAARNAAAAAVTVAESELTRAEGGRWGHAGHAIDLLEQFEPPVRASGLFDEIEISEEARPAWEPRLWPWRNAVVVDLDDEAQAHAALAAVPGALVVVADRSDRAIQMPAGVHSRVPLGGFLSSLAERFRYEDEPAHVRDDGLGLSVLGGFAHAVTGRDALVAAARTGLDVAQQRSAAAESVLALAGIRVDLAVRDHDAAVAAARLTTMDREEEQIRARIALIDGRLPEAIETERTHEQLWTVLNGRAASHAKDLEIANLRWKEAQKIEKDRRDRLTEKKRTRERLQVIAWHELLMAADRNGEVVKEDDAVRSVAALYRMATESLAKALRLYSGEDDGTTAAGPPQQTVDLLKEFVEQERGALPTITLDQVAMTLRAAVDVHADNDEVIKTRVTEVRGVRAEALDALRREVADAAGRLEVLQDMIESQIEGNLGRISDAFNTLDHQRGGFGAEVHFTSIRPNGAGSWRWEVVPRWRRSPSGDLISYREVANGAQVKVLAVQLVLAAVLSDADSHGRVLVLDELGNSLGEVNRKDVLGALRKVAERQGITILGTCQDSVLVDAAEVCGELLWFTHASATDYYNMPTRVWGFDPSSERIELTADWIRAGRGLV